jgi:hypothetical protein
MSTSAQYASTPRFGSAILTTANNSLTAPSNTIIVTAGSSGTRIDYIDIQGVANTSAGVVNLFVFDGTNYILWNQVPIQAVTQSNTTPAFMTTLSSNGNANIMPLTLPTGYSLRAATMVAQTGVRVTAYGGDF